MRIKFAASSKTSLKTVASSESESPFASEAMPLASAPPSSEYSELIQSLFHTPTVIAIVGSSDGHNESRPGMAERFAAELGATTGKRTVVVALDKLLGLKAPSAAHQVTYAPGNAPHVWLWPSQESTPIEFLKSRGDIYPRNWLDTLRRNFDCVLLDCPNIQTAPGVTEIAAMADAVILAVEEGHTSKQQIQQDQQTLQLMGARVVGFILIQRRQ
jgi:hypothetical protein